MPEFKRLESDFRSFWNCKCVFGNIPKKDQKELIITFNILWNMLKIKIVTAVLSFSTDRTNWHFLKSSKYPVKMLHLSRSNNSFKHWGLSLINSNGQQWNLIYYSVKITEHKLIKKHTLFICLIHTLDFCR